MRTSVPAKRKMLVYLILFLALCIFSLIADSLAPHDAELVNLLEAKKAPGGEYLMGTDWLGVASGHGFFPAHQARFSHLL